jgi:long-subunit fatty acid transport protein
MRLNRGALGVAVLVCLSTPAHANIFDLYGFNARGIGLGGALVSLADDHTGTYYNPAALTQAQKIRFGAGFIMTKPVLHVNRMRPVCLDVVSVCESQFGSQYSTRESVLPQGFSGFTLGWVFPFGGFFENRLAFGFAVYLPSLNIVRAEALDPQTPHFYLYQNLPDQTVILASLAYRPWDWLSIGGGIQVLANVFGEASMDLHVLQGTFEKRDFEMSLIPKVAATAGVWLKPTDGLRIGFSYRQALDLTFGLPAPIGLGDTLALDLDIGGRVLYSPHQFGLGVSYELHNPDVIISAQVDYAMWSLAPDPSPRVAVDLSGTLVDGLGLGRALDISTENTSIRLGFRDTWTPRLGVEWTTTSWLQVRGGYFFRPSPAPAATGMTSYLDNSVHGFSGGVTFMFDDPFQVHPNPVHLALAGQVGWLPNQHVVKESTVGGVGDLEHGGLTYSLAVSITHTY